MKTYEEGDECIIHQENVKQIIEDHEFVIKENVKY